MKKPNCNLHQCQCPHCIQEEDYPDKELHRQFNLLLSHLDEQSRRWVAAFLSRWIGWGGISLVGVITGLSRLTISRGLKELNEGFQTRPPDHARRSGGGRHLKLTDDQLKRLEKLLAGGATAHGWHNNLWTSKRVAKVIRSKFGVDL